MIPQVILYVCDADKSLRNGGIGMVNGTKEYYIWFDPQSRILTFSRISGYLKKAFEERSELMAYAMTLTEEGYKIT